MGHHVLIVGALAVVALALVANRINTVPNQAWPAPPPPPPNNSGFSWFGAGNNQSSPNGTITTVNQSIAIANNALGAFNQLSSLWSDDDGTP